MLKIEVIIRNDAKWPGPPADGLTSKTLLFYKLNISRIKNYDIIGYV